MIENFIPPEVWDKGIKIGNPLSPDKIFCYEDMQELVSASMTAGAALFRCEFFEYSEDKIYKSSEYYPRLPRQDETFREYVQSSWVDFLNYIENNLPDFQDKYYLFRFSDNPREFNQMRGIEIISKYPNYRHSCYIPNFTLQDVPFRYRDAWKEALNFKGRAHCSDFWSFVLMSIPMIWGLYWLEQFLGISGLLYSFFVVNAVPFASLYTRRLHDYNVSGWWPVGFASFFLLPHLGIKVNLYLALAIIHIMLFILFYWSFSPGKPEANRYGPPREFK